MTGRLFASFARRAGLAGAFVSVIAPAAPRVTDGPPARHSAHGRVVFDVAVEDEADPWSRRDGTGYTNDVVQAAFRAAGAEARLLVVPYARCKQLVRAGSVVACFSMSDDSSSRSAVRFPRKPLFTCVSDYVESVDHPVHARRPGELPRGALVGVVRGYEYPASVYELARSGAIRLEYAKSEVINLHKLVAGRLTVAMVNHDDIRTDEYVAAIAGVGGRVRGIFTSGELPAYVGFSRRHPDAPRALATFERGAAAIEASGELARIKAAWIRRVRASIDAIRPSGR